MIRRWINVYSPQLGSVQASSLTTFRQPCSSPWLRGHLEMPFFQHSLQAMPCRARVAQKGVDVSTYLRDKPSVFGVLSRTQVFRQLALDFFERYPHAIGANLGCGMTHCFQWLDNRTNHWLDADVAQVIQLRKRLLPADNKRHLNAMVDLRTPGWWQRLGLPDRNSAVPVLVICEGVLMYLEAQEVEHVLREFGQNAPAGSEMLLDTLSWLAIGCAAMHQSVSHTHAEFKWGSKHMRDFTAHHPRLTLRS